METLLGALVGALIGSIGATMLAHHLASRRAEHDASRVIVTNYLVQLQEAVESLWFRINNLAFERGVDHAPDPDYYEHSSPYALAVLFARERLLTEDGVFGHMEELWRNSGRQLRKALIEAERSIGRDRSGYLHFPKYYRLEVGDMALAYDAGGRRLKSYTEWTEAVAGLKSHPSLSAARDFFVQMDDPVAKEVLIKLDAVGALVSERTGIPLAYAHKRESAIGQQ